MLHDLVVRRRDEEEPTAMSRAPITAHTLAALLEKFGTVTMIHEPCQTDPLERNRQSGH